MNLDDWIDVLLIFCVRLTAVFLTTLKVLLLERSYYLAAGGLGFLASLLWLFALAKVLTNLNKPIKFVAFAAGYSVGMVLSGTIDQWVSP